VISDSEYDAWLRSTKKSDVVLVEITTLSGTVLRASTKQYKHPQHIYRSRLKEFETQINVESGIAGFSVFGVGDLVLENSDQKLDSWLEETMQGITVLYGDTSWDYADFRTLQTGEFYTDDSADDEIIITLRDPQSTLDLIVDDTLITATTGLPGSLARSVMIQSGLFAAGDIDTSSFNDLDVQYPYSCEITVNPDGENLAGILDRVLAGFPCDYGVDLDGLVRCFVFSKPVSVSVHRTITPIEKIQTSKVAPYWQVNFKSVTSLWSDIQESRQAIKDDSPDANVFNASISVSSSANAQLLANDYLDLFNQSLTRCTAVTEQSISGIQPLDVVKIVYPGNGFQAGRYGRVMTMQNRVNSGSQIEAFCV